MIPASAKAQTPFGVLAGRTFLNVHRDTENLAHTSLLCGPTPVSFAVSDTHLDDYINALIDCVAANVQATHRERLDAARQGAAS